MQLRLQQTIVALSTPPGVGALGLIRLSGPDCLLALSGLWKGRPITQWDSHKAYLGKLVWQEQLLDEVVATWFQGPKSFTGQDMLELSCHGSPYIVQQVIQALLANGCVLAAPGEFSQRAFANGKVDLSQAEAIADLIHAETAASHQLAMQQFRGGYSNTLKQLRQRLIDFAALIELELDFGEEDVTFANRDELAKQLAALDQTLKGLMDSFAAGNVIKRGLPVIILGKPNAGKSTLLNALLQEDKAIVSSIAGTTRDLIEETINLGGYQVRFIDTAGLRDTNDEIEAIGVNKSLERAQAAELVLYLYDPENEVNPIADYSALSLGKPVIYVATKVDLRTGNFELPVGGLAISAATGLGLDALKAALLKHIESVASQVQGQLVLTNLRHYQQLAKTRQALSLALERLHQQTSGEVLAFDIREAMHHLGAITGEVDNEEVLGSIFSRFCIGK